MHRRRCGRPRIGAGARLDTPGGRHPPRRSERRSDESRCENPLAARNGRGGLGGRGAAGRPAAACAPAVMLGVPRLLPASLWLDPRATMPMTPGLLLSYLAFGALGASLSRRAGARIAARRAAGAAP